MAKPNDEQQVYGDDFAFDYNEEDASKADSAADRLSESGYYIGYFKVVSPFKSEKGSTGVQFDVQLDGDATTNFALYIRNKDGKEIFGMQNFQAIRTVLGCKSRAVPVKGTIRKYDETERSWVDADGPVYADMQNKKIGLVLQKEIYTKTGNGGEGVRFNLITVADAKTRKTAKEIINNDTTAKRLDKILKALVDKDTRTVKNVGNADLGLADDGGPNYGGL